MITKLKRLSKKSVSLVLILAMLLSVIVVGIVTVNAWAFNGRIYFDNTDTQWGSVGAKTWGTGGDTYVQFTQQSGTNYWYYDNLYSTDNRTGFLFYNRSEDIGSDINQTVDIGQHTSGVTCFTPSGGSSSTKWNVSTASAPGVYDLTATVTGSSGGTGTNADPYIIPTGSSVTITANCTNVYNDGFSRNYSFNNGSYSSTTTYTVNAGNPGETQNVVVSARAVGNNNSNYVSRAISSTVFFRTAGTASGYYMGGRMKTASGDFDTWAGSTLTGKPLLTTDTPGLYKFETGKTVAQLSVNHNSNPQYFYIHEGNGAATANKWYGSTGGNGNNFHSNKSTNKLSYTAESGTSTNTEFLFRFNDATDKHRNVVIWFDTTNQQIYYTADDPSSSWEPEDIADFEESTDTGDIRLWFDSNNNLSGKTVYTPLKKSGEDKYWVELSETDRDKLKGANKQVYFAITHNNSASGVTTDSLTVNVDNAQNITWSGSTENHLNTSDPRIIASIKTNSSHDEYEHVGIYIDYTTRSKPVYYVYTSLGVVPFDGYYIGGRFTIYNSSRTTPTSTGTSQSDWKSKSTNIKFTALDASGNVIADQSSASALAATKWKLHTYQTIPELSRTVQGSDQTDKHLQFIVHDQTNFFGDSTNKNLGNNFHLNTSLNKLTLNKVSTLLPSNEMWFNNTSFDSDGQVIIYLDTSYKDTTGIKIWYELEKETKAVSDSAYIITSPEVLEAGETSTVIFRAVNPKPALYDNTTNPITNHLIYTIKDGDTTIGVISGGSVTTNTTGTSGTTTYGALTHSTSNDLEWSFTVSDSASTTHNFTITVSTSNTYDGTSEGNDVSTPYRSRSATASVTFNPPALYLFETSNGVDAGYTASNWEGPKSLEVVSTKTPNTAYPDSYEFVLSNKAGYVNPVDFKNYTFDEAASQYVDFKTESMAVMINGEANTTTKYIIKPRVNCNSLQVSIDPTTKKISAVATYTEAKTKTKSESKTVTYYFAEATDFNGSATNTGTQGNNSVKGSDPSTNPSDNAGMRIIYWNNSLDDVTDHSTKKYSTTLVKNLNSTQGIDVVDPAYVNGGSSNSIYINMDELYNAGTWSEAETTLANKEFKIYKVELPIWATSFSFVQSDGTVIETRTIKKAWEETVYSSLLLNPNRVYLLFRDTGKSGADNRIYCKGVVLDQNLWTNGSTANTNQTTQKTFKSNAVNFEKTYDSNGKVSGSFNTNLSTHYQRQTFANPLYFGYFGQNSTSTSGDGNGLNNFKITNNLAMRTSSENDERYYFASVQGLASRLIGTKKNANGFGSILSMDNKQLPLFDYKKLNGDETYTSGDNNYNYTNLVRTGDADSRGWGSETHQVYEGLNFPFNQSTYNGVVTYSFDSSTDYNRALKKTGNVIDFANEKEYRGMLNGGDIGYVPFYNPNNTSATADGYGSATEFDIEFYMSNTGNLVGTNGFTEDIAFNFTGDDDVWVYVDGVLVLDLGGAHKASAGSINFTEMKVYYKTAARNLSDNFGINDAFPANTNYVNTLDLGDILEAHGVNFKNNDASKKHTFQMFYMERGQFDSNMSISFNLPQADGLKITNEVTVNNVNYGLKEAALKSASTDYFTYYLQNKNASFDDITRVKATDAKGNAISYANALEGEVAGLSLSYASPLYPYLYNTERAYPDKNDPDADRYTLSSNQDTRTPAQGNSFTIGNDWASMKGVVYSLSDSYIDPANKNFAAVTGKTDTSDGAIHLLDGQGATFNNKVKANSMVRVWQSQQKLGTIGDDATNKVIKYDDVNDNNVGNYYVTSYDIYDAAAQKIIVDTTEFPQSVANAADFYAADNSANNTDKGFYYSKYANNEGDEKAPAMNVNFHNDIAVGSIKVEKELSDGSSSEGTFVFQVKLGNIFGNGDYTLKEYDNLKYVIYSVATGKPVGTGAEQFYNSSVGIILKAGQYALITGVPVESTFQITEKPKGGFSFVKLNKTVYNPAGTKVTTATKIDAEHSDWYTEEITSSASTSTDYYDKPTGVEGKYDRYYKNMIPTVGETLITSGDFAGEYVSTSEVIFLNKKETLSLIFKYYDREVVNGEPAHINTKPSEYSVSVDQLNPDGLNYYLVENNNVFDYYDFASMLRDAKVYFAIHNPIGNVVDTYDMWDSQADALNETTGVRKYKNLAQNSADYTTEQLAYHTDSLGKPLTAAEAYGERWVTYMTTQNQEVTYTKDGNNVIFTNSASDHGNVTAYSSVNSMVIWLYNIPRQYNVKVFGAKQYSDLHFVNGKYVATDSTSSKVEKVDSDGVYYNQRLGYVDSDTSLNNAAYLSQYGIAGCRSDIEPSELVNDTITYDDGGTTKALKFQYWAFDEEGTQIASYDSLYHYRITNSTNLYAVYGDAEISGYGMTLTMNEEDSFIENNVPCTRINALGTIYGLEDNDKNIQQVSMIHIYLSNQVRNNMTDSEIKTLFENHKNDLKTIIATYSDKSTFYGKYLSASSSEVPGSVDVMLTTKGYVYTIKGTDAEQNAPSKVVGKLTNKNRAQFTTTFNTSQLYTDKGKVAILAVGAMKYGDTYSSAEWKISDNALIYHFEKAAD